MLKSLKIGGVSRVKNPRVSKTPVDPRYPIVQNGTASKLGLLHAPSV